MIVASSFNSSILCKIGGSTSRWTDAAGNDIASFRYKPFGEIAAQSGSTTNPFQFAGEQRDAESGYSYLRARYYDPATGRFISRDPLGGGYAYAGNNPVNFTDPSGLFIVDPAAYDNYSDYWMAYMDNAGVEAQDTSEYTGWDNHRQAVLDYFGARASGWGGPGSGSLEAFLGGEYGYNPSGRLSFEIELIPGTIRSARVYTDPYVIYLVKSIVIGGTLYPYLLSAWLERYDSLLGWEYVIGTDRLSGCSGYSCQAGGVYKAGLIDLEDRFRVGGQVNCPGCTYGQNFSKTSNSFELPFVHMP